MSKSIYDFDNKGFIFPTSDHTGLGSDGNIHMRVSDNLSMDLDSGQIHVNTGWDNKKNVRRSSPRSSLRLGVSPVAYLISCGVIILLIIMFFVYIEFF